MDVHRNGQVDPTANRFSRRCLANCKRHAERDSNGVRKTSLIMALPAGDNLAKNRLQ
jgi:hypothetical protein